MVTAVDPAPAWAQNGASYNRQSQVRARAWDLRAPDDAPDVVAFPVHVGLLVNAVLRASGQRQFG